MKIPIVRELLEANRFAADEIRKELAARDVRMVNVMGSPGSGKTRLIERTIEVLRDEAAVSVIEGDIATTLDAERLSRWGIPVVQINTGPFGGACHLPARAIGSALERLDLESADLVLVENVGNLVCPAEFDIGENTKVVVLSVTEGEDKPLKYPLMFRESRILVINKIDLLPHLEVDVSRLEANARGVNPALRVVRLSAATGENVSGWVEALRREQEQAT
jgi:hydrogenase nickel incorporation protein HypB